MDTLTTLETLFDKKRIQILKLFLQDKTKQFYLREISNLAKVPVASTFRIVDELVNLKVLKIIKIKKFKLYQIDDNKIVKFLENFLRVDKQILDIFVDTVKGIEGVDLIISHGKPTKDRANVLIIGENVDGAKIKEAIGDIKEKHKFTISSLTLAREQFDQMSAMGLYSGEKKILFRKS